MNSNQNIFELFDKTLLNNMVSGGFVKVQNHPEAPYVIYNYTDMCTWEGVWNEVTLNCRGLIVDSTSGNVVARGMSKFFNHDQEESPKFSLEDRVTVSDKADGSLGILYYLPDSTEAIATRGSFTSEQAVWATNWWRSNRPNLALESGKTYLFEIIYPDNRIVVDYNGKEGLVFLGTVDNETGLFEPGWIPETDCATRYSYETWGEVLAAPDRQNAEGFVVTRKSDGAMVKIKYEDYKRLHKYMTRITERHVWECLMDGRDLQTEFQGAPDEFHQWVINVAHGLQMKKDDEYLRLKVNYLNIKKSIPEDLFIIKKEFALVVKDMPDSAAMFLLYENRDIETLIWKKLKPEASTFKNVSSDSN